MASTQSNLVQLQNEWKQIFQHTLPEAATSKSPSQPKWPVHVDHCFARIILDSVVGIDVPWMQKIKSPAYKNMSEQQLRESIELGEKIWSGEANLVELDNKSLELRGKGKGKSDKASGKVGKGGGSAEKRKREDSDEDDERAKRKKEESPEPGVEVGKSPYFGNFKPSRKSDGKGKEEKKETKGKEEKKDDLEPWLKKIALSDKTSFQKRVLTTLCQVPRGKYTTYGAMSEHLSSSPRAVGNALRNNPFAPHVPCHRVLASGGGLGGFHGSWGKNGEEGLHDDKKRKLLRDEGVRFDGKGKVVGALWTGFV